MGGAYSTATNLLQRLQKRTVKIINKNNFAQDNPLGITLLFAYDSLIYHYRTLKVNFLNSASKTRNKSIQIPGRLKTVCNKNSYVKYRFQKLF